MKKSQTNFNTVQGNSRETSLQRGATQKSSNTGAAGNGSLKNTYKNLAQAQSTNEGPIDAS